jgi:2,3-bisphosphoglycerate-dependent phosphoglycerate mutase
MEILLVRHALPVRVETGDGTPADPPLSDLGHLQAKALAEWLGHETVDVIHTSPMLRARQTAAPLEEATGLKAVVTEGVSEYDRFADAYVPMEELKRTDYARWLDIVQGRGLGTDDPVVFQALVVETVEGLVGANPGRRVVVVCHGGVINSYVAHVLGRPAGDIFFFDPAYTSINRVLAAGSGERSIVSLNERGHLRGLPTTGRADGV